ncbi:MAG: ABC transporter permease [Candidatus Aminicenantes bacterium]|nr:ABC transporter permease [Candidatus Aminicenantes bacterium]
MGPKNKVELSFVLKSVGRIFSFFFTYGKKTRRTKVFYFISLFPVFLAVVIKTSQLLSGEPSMSGIQVFSEMIMTFYLQFLILILSLFFGTSVCSEEIENKTLTYLTTRPVPKSAIILGKYAAYSLLVLLMVGIGLVASFFILNFEKLLDFSIYPLLLKDFGILSLGVFCYMALFTLMGTFLRRSIIVGLIFSFGWENVIQYFPGSTQRFAIVHYLKSLLPTHYSGGKFSILLFQLEPTSAGAAVFMLVLLTGVFLALACSIFSRREYILED